MHTVRIELAKLILAGTRITHQATGDAGTLTTLLIKLIIPDYSNCTRNPRARPGNAKTVAKQKRDCQGYDTPVKEPVSQKALGPDMPTPYCTVEALYRTVEALYRTV